MYYYKVFDLHIVSDIHIPQFAQTKEMEEVDFTIKIAPDNASTSLVNPTNSKYFQKHNVFVQYDNKHLLIEHKQKVCFYFKDRKTVLVKRDINLDENKLSTLLSGGILSVYLMLNRKFLLHGCAVEINGKANLFLGSSGNGKSTLAALLVKQGYKLISDDICFLERDAANKGWIIYPSYPSIKLLPDSYEAVENNNVPTPVIMQDLQTNKSQYNYSGFSVSKTREVENIFILDNFYDLQEVEIIPLDFVEALKKVQINTYRKHFIKLLSIQTAHLEYCHRISSSIPVYNIRRPFGIQHCNSLIDEIVNLYCVL
ncbi:MAG: hypothetical protein ACJAWV_001674 [Flammeovirgaceae bacterium]|jgi:hypothetical protein